MRYISAEIAEVVTPSVQKKRRAAPPRMTNIGVPSRADMTSIAPPTQTPQEAVRYAGAMSESNAVAFLIRYLFSYQQASQKIGDLSGGERSRLQLALLVLSGANFLLLDEPTNNLDVASAEVLENALEDFEGTVLVISHDRYFLDRTINRLLVLEGGQLKEYQGGYSDYAAAISTSIG